MAAGYSGTPQARKLGIKSGQRVCIDSAPAGWVLTDPPPDVVYVEGSDPAEIIVSFFAGEEELARRLPDLVPRIYPAGALWIAWPRRAGGHLSDITDNVVRRHALALGVVDVKIAAIDDDWSGQKVVWRLSHRAETPRAARGRNPRK
jgi:hypothetical protein